MRAAQLTKKIIFWLDTINGTIKMGLPEQYPAPAYHEKIICNTVQDAERWSQKMRLQEQERLSMEDDKRQEIEEKIRGEIRSHINHLMANARNNMNRDFLRLHRDKYDKRPDLTRMKRESYLHSEGFEHGR